MFYDLITINIEIYVEENERSFCATNARKLLRYESFYFFFFFDKKKIGIFQILTFEILTKF